MTRMLFLYNPQSGQQKIKNQLWGILNAFSMADFDIRVRALIKNTDAAKIVTEMKDEYDVLVCSGGDGTLNRVVNGMMRLSETERKPIGYIPAGSTNDFAVSLKIPKDMQKAAQNIILCDSRRFDVGAFNDKHFVYVAAFGAFTEVSFQTDQGLKNALGHLAYIISGVASLASLKPYSMKIRTEERNYDGDYFFGMITNSLSVGGIYRMDEKEVQMDDGLFEVTLIRMPKSLAELQAMGQTLFTADPMVETFKTDHIWLESSDSVPWTLDGEDGKRPQKVEICVKRRALEIITE